MKKKTRSSVSLGVEQIEDRITPSGTPADVFFASHQIKANSEILRFVTDDQLVGNPFTQPLVGAFLDHVHQTNTAAVNEINLFLTNLMAQHGGNPLTSDFFAEHMVNYSSLLAEAGVGIAYAKSFADILKTPLTLVPPPPANGPNSPSPAAPPNNGGNNNNNNSTTADLRVNLTNANATYTPGTTVTYSLTASNGGPATVNGARVQSIFGANLTNISWTAAYSTSAVGPTSGTGNINANLTLPSGGVAIFTITGTALSSALGDLTSTANITAPAGITDTNPSNNSVTETDTADRRADLSITASDGNATYSPGETLTYTVRASNNGPSDVGNATIRDAFSVQLTGVTWTATYGNGSSGPANGTGNFNVQVGLASGSNVTFTITGTVAANTTGNLLLTANITAPAGITDVNTSNNSSTDTNILEGTTDTSTDAGMENVLPDTSSGFIDIGDGITIRDMVVGTGSTVTETSTVTIFYTGWVADSGVIFDSRRSPSAAVQFGLGGTIEGFREGVAGMQIGGIRQIFIPAEKAYGSNPPSGIPVDADLVFEVKLISSP